MRQRMLLAKAAGTARYAFNWGLARLHRRIRCRRTGFLHKTTTDLAKTESVIVVQDLLVRGMIRNRHLARSSAEPGWPEFRRMLAYKTQWYGSLAGRCPALLFVQQDVLGPRLYQSRNTAWRTRIVKHVGRRSTGT